MRYLILLLLICSCTSQKECTTVYEDYTHKTTINFNSGNVIVKSDK